MGLALVAGRQDADVRLPGPVPAARAVPRSSASRAHSRQPLSWSWSLRSMQLFDAFASKEKSLHVNSGKHKDLPRFEADSAVRFFARHLGSTVTSPA
ncbi:hypothetical protein ABH925_004757 [Streptacidiphilus sp. EB129]